MCPFSPTSRLLPTTEIALLLRPATDLANYKGTIFLNPGGPGGSGTALMPVRGEMISKIVGPEFDLLGFDPRGVGATTPPAQCFGSDRGYKQWGLQSLYSLLLSAKETFGRARSREKVVADMCLRALGGNGKEEAGGTGEEWGAGRFMSTPYVATDMLKIVEKLGQEKLQYWGFSYGTVLGQYFAAMYPDKVGRLVLDGVFDAENYSKGLWSSNLEFMESVHQAFYGFCSMAGPSNCAIYEPSPERVKERVDKIFVDLVRSPVPVPFASSGPAVITKDFARVRLFQALYEPYLFFGHMADELYAVETRNQTVLEEKVDGLLSHSCDCGTEGLPWTADNEALYAVACGDSGPLIEEPGQFEAHYAKLAAKSPLVAPMWALFHLRCLEWKIEAKWRYTGPYSANNTAHPILIVNPSYDPVCPITDARKVRERYAGAGLLEQHSYGHCSWSAPSVCTAKAVRTYFVNGTLPEEGTVCEPDRLPFGMENGKKVQTLSMEDVELLDALRRLAGAVPGLGPW